MQDTHTVKRIVRRWSKPRWFVVTTSGEFGSSFVISSFVWPKNRPGWASVFGGEAGGGFRTKREAEADLSRQIHDRAAAYSQREQSA